MFTCFTCTCITVLVTSMRIYATAMKILLGNIIIEQIFSLAFSLFYLQLFGTATSGNFGRFTRQCYFSIINSNSENVPNRLLVVKSFELKVTKIESDKKQLRVFSDVFVLKNFGFVRHLQSFLSIFQVP